jgi:hypothetical protein
MPFFLAWSRSCLIAENIVRRVDDVVGVFTTKQYKKLVSSFIKATPPSVCL